MGGVPRFTSFRFAVVVALEGVVGAVCSVSRRFGLRLLLLLKEWGEGVAGFTSSRVAVVVALEGGGGEGGRLHVVACCSCCSWRWVRGGSRFTSFRFAVVVLLKGRWFWLKPRADGHVSRSAVLVTKLAR